MATVDEEFIDNESLLLNQTDIDKKKASLTEKLQRREEVRIGSIQKKKEEKVSLAAEGENSQYFFETFQKLQLSIADSIFQSSKVSKTNLLAHFSSVATELNKLNKFITECTIFLPAFDVQKSQDIVASLQSELQKAQEEFLPKKKFAFKARPKSDKENKCNQKKETLSSDSKKQVYIQVDELVIKNVTHQSIQKNSSEVDSKDVVQSNLQHSSVVLHGNASSMQVDNLQSCKVFCGPVSRSIFINNCDNCTFVLACQQLRIHNTSNSIFFIHVTTRAIIEDSTNVKFGKYYMQYPGVDDDFARSGLDMNRNNWNDIDDFNYLASKSQSPNWSLVSEDEQAAMEK